MLFKTYRENAQRARVLHYLCDKALEQVLTEGDKFHEGLESGEIRFGSNNLDVPFIDARAAAHGLELFTHKVEFMEEAGPVTQKMLERHLNWFVEQLNFQALQAHNQQNQQLEALQFEAATQFVYELLHPKTGPIILKSIPELDNRWATG